MAARLPGSYRLDPARALAARALMARPGAVLLTGAPGTGKTALGEAVACALGAELLVLQAHAWTDAEDLFVGVNVAEAVAGRAERVMRPGVLLDAARRTRAGQEVVVLLDELDKAAERVDALLLDYLQSGRCPGPDGMERADLSRLRVVITSNGAREMADALLRRCLRVELPVLPEHVEVDVLRKQTGRPVALLRAVRRMAQQVRDVGTSCPSLPEMIRLVEDLALVAVGDPDAGAGAEQCELLLRGWLCKSPEDWQALTRGYTRPGAALWGVVCSC